eukprot:s233_g19.t1
MKMKMILVAGDDVEDDDGEDDEVTADCVEDDEVEDDEVEDDDVEEDEDEDDDVEEGGDGVLVKSLYKDTDLANRFSRHPPSTRAVIPKRPAPVPPDTRLQQLHVMHSLPMTNALLRYRESSMEGRSARL